MANLGLFFFLKVLYVTVTSHSLGFLVLNCFLWVLTTQCRDGREDTAAGSHGT